MTPTPKDPVDALMALVKECGATVYTHRTSPHEPAVAFSPSAWEAFSARVLAAVPATSVASHGLEANGVASQNSANVSHNGVQQAGGVPAGLSEEYPAPYRCLKPHCPPRCSGCNHAIPVTDTPKMLMLKVLDQLAVDDLGNPFEEGDHPAVDAARAWLCAAPSPSAVQPLIEAQNGEPVRDEREAFNIAWRQTWGMVDPLRPPAPGSYYLGEHNGIIAALKTIRENFDHALKGSAS